MDSPSIPWFLVGMSLPRVVHGYRLVGTATLQHLNRFSSKFLIKNQNQQLRTLFSINLIFYKNFCIKEYLPCYFGGSLLTHLANRVDCKFNKHDNCNNLSPASDLGCRIEYNSMAPNSRMKFGESKNRPRFDRSAISSIYVRPCPLAGIFNIAIWRQRDKGMFFVKKLPTQINVQQSATILF